MSGIRLMRDSAPEWSQQLEQQQAQQDGDEIDLEQHIDDNDDQNDDGNDDDSQDGNDDGGDDGDDGNDDDDDAPLTAGSLRRLLQEQEQRLSQSTQSEIDRRINQALGNRNRNNAGNSNSSKGGNRQVQQTSASAPDVRTARLALREELPSQLRFLSPEERKTAMDLGRDLIDAEAHRGFDDPDKVGTEIAEKVAGIIKNQRSYYSKRTRTALQRQGLLPEQKEQPGSTSGPVRQKQGTTKAGPQLAQNIRAELFPGQVKTEQ